MLCPKERYIRSIKSKFIPPTDLGAQAGEQRGVQEPSQQNNHIFAVAQRWASVPEKPLRPACQCSMVCFCVPRLRIPVQILHSYAPALLKCQERGNAKPGTWKRETRNTGTRNQERVPISAVAPETNTGEGGGEGGAASQNLD